MIEKLKARIVDDWKEMHKWWSVRIGVLIVVSSTADQYIPALQQYVSPDIIKYLAIAAVVARVVKQAKQVKNDQ